MTYTQQLALRIVKSREALPQRVAYRGWSPEIVPPFSY
jgi:ATP phosphoribosyltransferase regulatory subunit HisZ